MLHDTTHSNTTNYLLRTIYYELFTTNYLLRTIYYELFATNYLLQQFSSGEMVVACLRALTVVVADIDQSAADDLYLESNSDISSSGTGGKCVG